MNFLVMISNPSDGSYTSVLIQNPIYFNATEFIASNEAILIAGYFNFRPIILHYSLIEKRSRILPGFLNEPGELIQIKTYPEGNIDVVISAKNASRKKCIWIRHFDKTGDLIKTVVIEPEENKNLIFGRVEREIADVDSRSHRCFHPAVRAAAHVGGSNRWCLDSRHHTSDPRT